MENNITLIKKVIRILGLTLAALFLLLAVCAAVYIILKPIHSRRTAWIKTGLDKKGQMIWQEPNQNCADIAWNRDTNNDGKINEAQAVDYARSMLNIPYDPLMGRYNDFFGKAGFVVCIDVPLRSYLRAGISMPAMLKTCSKEHPEWFKVGANNSPNNSFFYRRVRNYYDLFEHHPNLETDQDPKPGDWMFFGRHHIGLVISVDKDGNYKAIEANPFKGRVVVSDRNYIEQTWGAPAFFGRIKYRSN